MERFLEEALCTCLCYKGHADSISERVVHCDGEGVGRKLSRKNRQSIDPKGIGELS